MFIASNEYAAISENDRACDRKSSLRKSDGRFPLDPQGIRPEGFHSDQPKESGNEHHSRDKEKRDCPIRMPGNVADGGKGENVSERVRCLDRP